MDHMHCTRHCATGSNIKHQVHVIQVVPRRPPYNNLPCSTFPTEPRDTQRLHLLLSTSTYTTKTHRPPRRLRPRPQITTVSQPAAANPKRKRVKTEEITTLLANFTNPLRTWIRDLTQEGIEPNPGPGARYITKNVNGLQGAGKLYQCCKAIAAENQRLPITALFIQEHNLKQTDSRAHEKIARGHQLLILLAYAPLQPNQSVPGGHRHHHSPLID